MQAIHIIYSLSQSIIHVTHLGHLNSLCSRASYPHPFLSQSIVHFISTNIFINLYMQSPYQSYINHFIVHPNIFYAHMFLLHLHLDNLMYYTVILFIYANSFHSNSGSNARGQAESMQVN